LLFCLRSLNCLYIIYVLSHLLIRFEKQSYRMWSHYSFIARTLHVEHVYRNPKYNYYVHVCSNLYPHFHQSFENYKQLRNKKSQTRQHALEHWPHSPFLYDHTIFQNGINPPKISFSSSKFMC
jgi:uncharacterized protein (DUF2225 family)